MTQKTTCEIEFIEPDREREIRAKVSATLLSGNYNGYAIWVATLPEHERDAIQSMLFDLVPEVIAPSE